MTGRFEGVIRILAVEDNPKDALLLRESLADAAPCRFEVEHVSTGAGALERLTEEDFDVAILDLYLPDTDGFDLLDKIAARVPGLPVLMASGASDEMVAVEALKRGAQDYIVKGRGDGHLLSRAILYAIERKKIEQRLAWFALHDSLTGLPNRHAFRVRLEQALARAERNDEAVAVLFLDLDRFKEVNDSHGHDAGDTVLRAVAERFRGSVREMDTVSRLAGDEFVVLLESIPSQEAAETVARKILKTLEPPIPLQGGAITVTASLGIAYCAQSRDCMADALVRNADRAMYRAKANRAGGFAVFAGEVHADCRVAVCGGTRLCDRGALRKAEAETPRAVRSAHARSPRSPRR